MLNSARKNYVYTVWWKSETGFTIASHLLKLSVILISVPFFIYVLENVKLLALNETLSLQQFFFILQTEVYVAEHIETNGQMLSLTMPSGETAQIHLYENQIRRRVEEQGHEIYLRNVQGFTIEPLSYGIHVKVTTLKGAIYERTIVFT